MPMMMSQILKFVYFTKREKSGYLQNETFYEYKNSLIVYQGLPYGKNSFVAEVTFKQILSINWWFIKPFFFSLYK